MTAARAGRPALVSRPLFDRTVGMALVLAVALETAGAIHWAGRTGQRLAHLETKASLTHPIDLRLARMEEQVAASQATLLRIEADLHVVEGAAHD